MLHFDSYDLRSEIGFDIRVEDRLKSRRDYTMMRLNGQAVFVLRCTGNWKTT